MTHTALKRRALPLACAALATGVVVPAVDAADMAGCMTNTAAKPEMISAALFCGSAK